MARRLNIKSFSEQIGYSVATVSRALNPQTASMVKEETRKEIQQLATQLNFVPHPGARLLRRNQPAPIAVLLPQKEGLFLSEYYSRLLMGILQQTSARGQAVYAMAFSPTEADFKDQLNEVTVGCDSIIYLSDPLTTQMAASLGGLRQPFVCPMNCLPPEIKPENLPVPVFGLNDRAGSRQATEHLIEIGHRNIAFLGGAESKRDARERRKGYEDALLAHGLRVRPEWMLESIYTFQAGMDAAAQIQPLLKDITAVVCTTDEQALGLMRELSIRGVRCPEDVSITGFDDLQWARRFIPALTTVQQPLMQMAVAAVEMVSPEPAASDLRQPVASRFFEPVLAVRKSTDRPRR